MNLADLTKEQKQYLGLGGLGAVILIVLAVMGIRFGLSLFSVATLELDDLTEKIERADKALARKNQTSEEFEQTVSLLKVQLKNTPPKKNYYSWATEIVYSTGRDSGMEIQSVDEMGAGSGAKKPKDETSLKFEMYSLRITANGDYEQIKQFILKIEEDHPLVRFAGLEISVDTDPRAHNIQLFIQWPFNLGDFEKRWADVRAQQLKLGKRKKINLAPPTVIAPLDPAPVEKPAPVAVLPKVKKSEPVVAAKPTPKPIVVPKPTPVVKQRAPEPVAAPVPKVVVSAPKSVAPVPKPEPKPVQKVEPTPIIEKPAPVMVAVPKPVVKPAPIPVVEKPAPSIVAVKPVVEPAPLPIIETPAPIVVAVAPEPVIEPKIVEIVPVAKPLPKVVVKPEPVVVAAPKPAPVESVSEPVVEPEPPVQEDSFGSLLASLNSQGEKPIEPVESELEDLDPFIKQLKATSVPVVETPEPEPEMIAKVVPEPIVQPAVDEPVRYVSSSKSAKKITELLTKEERKTSASLSSFLDGLVEEINDKR